MRLSWTARALVLGLALSGASCSSTKGGPRDRNYGTDVGAGYAGPDGGAGGGSGGITDLAAEAAAEAALPEVSGDAADGATDAPPAGDSAD